MSKPLYMQMTVVSVRKDEDHNAYLIKAEGKMGSRMSWFEQNKPKISVGDTFTTTFNWK